MCIGDRFARLHDYMTIVLQKLFWDITVDEDGVSVGLSFSDIPSTIVVPCAAITGFVDPAVNFALQFQAQGDDHAPNDHAENDPPAAEPIEDGSNVVSVDFKRKK